MKTPRLCTGAECLFYVFVAVLVALAPFVLTGCHTMRGGDAPQIYTPAHGYNFGTGPLPAPSSR